MTCLSSTHSLFLLGCQFKKRNGKVTKLHFNNVGYSFFQSFSHTLVTVWDMVIPNKNWELPVATSPSK